MPCKVIHVQFVHSVIASLSGDAWFKKIDMFFHSSLFLFSWRFIIVFLACD